MTDDAIKAAQAGDAKAFNRLLQDHYDRIFSYAYKWCGNRTDAEDITQQACIKLAHSISQFRFEAAFTTWLYRLVINCAKDWQRSQARHQYVNPEEAPVQITPNATHDPSIYLQQILQAISLMGDGFKETVILVLGEGLNHREAGEALAVKESTISWRIHKVREHLASLAETDHE